MPDHRAGLRDVCGEDSACRVPDIDRNASATWATRGVVISLLITLLTAATCFAASIAAAPLTDFIGMSAVLFRNPALGNRSLRSRTGTLEVSLWEDTKLSPELHCVPDGQAKDSLAARKVIPMAVITTRAWSCTTSEGGWARTWSSWSMKVRTTVSLEMPRPIINNASSNGSTTG